jgi:hypothetical protein
MGVAARLLPFFLLVLTLATAQAKETAGLKRRVGEAEVDFGAGTITVQAGAAADSRMPGANAARPGAERRARAAAEAKLEAAARALTGGETKLAKGALERAVVSRIEYQSNGGVVLWLTLRFFDVVPAAEAAIALKVASMPLAFAPSIASAGKESQLGFATYRFASGASAPTSPAPRDAIVVRRDGKGRLVLPAGEASRIDSLAGAAVVIYLEKAQP